MSWNVMDMLFAVMVVAHPALGFIQYQTNQEAGNYGIHARATMNDKRVAEVVVDYCSVCPEEVIRIVEGKEICLCGKINRVTYESDIIPPDRLLPEAERVAQFRKQPPYKKQEKIVFNETSIPDWCPLPKAKGWVMSDRRVATLVVRNCRECPSAVHAIIEGKQKKVCLKLHKKGISFFAIFLPDCPLPKAKED